jgi:hypothetical protein
MPETKDQAASYAKSVFLNCPFDNDYKPVFEALIFAVFDCGYRPRCALEIDDAGQVPHLAARYKLLNTVAFDFGEVMLWIMTFLMRCVSTALSTVSTIVLR